MPSVPAPSTTIGALERHLCRRGAVLIQAAQVHCPRSVGALGDMAHAGVREEFRAVARGVGEIGQRDGVLGADIAASAAVAAARAGGLGDARAIDHRIEG